MPETTPQVSPAETKIIQPKLSSFTELFKISFANYKTNFGKYICLQLIPLIAAIPLAIFTGAMAISNNLNNLNLTSAIIFGILVLVFMIGAIILSFYAQVALLLAIKNQDKKIKQLLIEAKPFINKYFTTTLLSGLLIMSGFILLIIPGIILAIYLCFAEYIVIYEGQKNFSALSRSKFLVKNYWWPIAFRLLGMIGIMIVLAMIFEILNSMFFGETKVLNNIPQFFIAPLMTIFMVNIYHNLIKIKGQGGTEVPKRGKIIAIILLCLIIPFLIFTTIVLSALGNARIKARDARRHSDIAQIQTSVELYLNDFGVYPDKLDDLTKINNPLPKIPTDPTEGKTYRYEKTPEGYKLCFDMENKNETFGTQKGENCVTQ